MRRKDFTTSQRNQLVQFLLEGSHEGKPLRGKFSEAVIKFGTSRRQIHRLWTTAKDQMQKGEAIYLQSGKVSKLRTKRVRINLELISNLELHKRGTIRSLAESINCKKSTVARWVRQGLIKAHTSSIRPDLTANNMLLSLRFSLEALELDRIMNTLQFRNMHNTVHIDEKWFYITKGTHRFYLTPAESEPHRTCKSKTFIPKVMFLCAVNRPLFGEDGSVLFDGKIWIFPLTEQVPANRTSKNRAACTMITKPLKLVTREVMGDFLVNKVLPVIKAKLPSWASKTIYIQQDNTKPHIKNSDKIFRDAAMTDGFNFILVQQPPNSQDTNVLDLGWFRTIQSIQIQSVCYIVDKLVEAVVLSFEGLCPTKLNKVFLSLQGCMVEIMKVKGHNCYKVPHMKKDACIRAGTLSLNLEVPEELVRRCISYLIAVGSLERIGDLMNALGIQSLDGQLISYYNFDLQWLHFLVKILWKDVYGVKFCKHNA